MDEGIKRWECLCFAAGVLALAVALLSPLDRASDAFLAAHMTRHELLMVVAAPLLVLGRAPLATLWAVPDGRRHVILDRLRGRRIRLFWKVVSGPVVVLIIHGALVWLWHVPPLFQWALEDEAVNRVQHFTFFAIASLFFWSLVRGRYGRLGYGLAMLFVFATATHTSVLGALITCAKVVGYPEHAERSMGIASAQLADQQLAGIVMWIPASAAFFLMALALFAAWVGESERRTARS